MAWLPSPWGKRMKYSRLSVLLLLCAVALIALGIQRGEAATVLQKGINLCLECVGIG